MIQDMINSENSITLMCLKYTKGMFCSNVTWLHYVLIPWQPFTEKERESLEKFFSSSGNAICAILLKYQHMYVEIQTFTDKN